MYREQYSFHHQLLETSIYSGILQRPNVVYERHTKGVIIELRGMSYQVIFFGERGVLFIS